MQQRSGSKQRSQTFKWFSSTLLYYFCDRIAMHMNHRYHAKLISYSAVWGTKGSKLIILKVQRPALFHFKSGQYAYIRIDAINTQWHPFSIASRPDSSYLEFYIQVYEGKAWTKQIWDLFDNESSFHNLKIEVMGPYGSSLTQGQNFSHIVAIGGGTGVVPILSMFKDHVYNLLRLDPKNFFNDLEESERRIEYIEDSQRCSLIQQFSSALFQKYSYGSNRRDEIINSRSFVDHDDLKKKNLTKKTKRKIYKSALGATLPIYGAVFLSILPVVGVTLFALVVSWNTTPVELYTSMAEFLK